MRRPSWCERRARVAAVVIAAAATTASIGACHDEPTFVITFAPQDGAGGAAAERDAGGASAAVARRAADAGATGRGAASVARDAGAKAPTAAAAGAGPTATPGAPPVTRTRVEGAPPTAGGASGGGDVPRACRRDSDCTVTREGCCGCSAGGSQMAIARAGLAAYERSRGPCGGVACLAMMSSHPSCAMVAACVSRRCALVEQPRAR